MGFGGKFWGAVFVKNARKKHIFQNFFKKSFFRKWMYYIKILFLKNFVGQNSFPTKTFYKNPILPLEILIQFSVQVNRINKMIFRIIFTNFKKFLQNSCLLQNFFISLRWHPFVTVFTKVFLDKVMVKTVNKKFVY